SHEAQYRERVVVVVAVAGTGAGRFGDEPGLLPVPDGLGGHATAFAQLADAHERTLGPLTFQCTGRFRVDAWRFASCTSRTALTSVSPRNACATSPRVIPRSASSANASPTRRTPQLRD